MTQQKESDIEQVEYNYAHATYSRKQAKIEKTFIKLQDEKAEMEVEFEKVSKEILDLSECTNYSL